MRRFILFFLFSLCFISYDFAQEKSASPFDFGRMWTFENPPIDWIKEAYDMDLEQAWFDDVRKSSLKFATWCSGSFVSPNGLIMTNHHCSRDESISVQNEGENFDLNGFYAKSLNDERRVEGLFVDQLIMVADVTEEVLERTSVADNDEQAAQIAQTALQEIQSELAQKSEWKGLRLQAISYYSGGKYSIYGYKRYNDIRLVLIPENDLGFYGGDPDNFTYPRYNLDFTFWRAYDENGEPLNTSEHYFEFNPKGISEGMPVFVVGNPASTERYRTKAQLEYDRDHRYKYLLHWLTNRRDMMQKEYDLMSQDKKQEREAQELMGTINNLSNSIKAYNGIMKGLHNKDFMNRKIEMEQLIRSKSGNLDHWDVLSNEYKKLIPHSWAITHLAASPFRGQCFMLMHQIEHYKSALAAGESSQEELDILIESIAKSASELDVTKEKAMLKMLLTEIKKDIYPGDNTLTRVLNGKSIDAYIDFLFDKSKILRSEESAIKCLSNEKNLNKSKDILIKASDIFVSRYNQAASAFSGSSAKRKALEAKIANQAFKVFGTSLPPDATFTLRISDGVVKSYKYNGTVAPVFTTFFGLYDRHYSHHGELPWSLPERWKNPSMELLRSPLNLVSTNDIIGGNSGSALINAKGEAVGLIFDGNIESLPGKFIYDEEYNRTVSVHAGGIYAALKYIYKADDLLKELIPE